VHSRKRQADATKNENRFHKIHPKLTTKNANHFGGQG
jgi:hypothetical protein